MHKALLLLRKIPKGKVTTYGLLAKRTNSSPRAIGKVMRNNRHPEKYPCYKVVRSDGRLGGYDGCVSGKNVQRKVALLKKDGIVVKNDKIDMKKCLHRF